MVIRNDDCFSERHEYTGLCHVNSCSVWGIVCEFCSGFIFLFSETPKPSWGLPRPLFSWSGGFFLGGLSGRFVKLTTPICTKVKTASIYFFFSFLPPPPPPPLALQPPCGLWPVAQYRSIFSYLWPALSIFSLLALEDLFLLPLSIPLLGLPLRLVPSSSWMKIFFGHPILLHSLQVT